MRRPAARSAGIRVIELGQVIAGPFCGQLLGDLGADVIKVEPPWVGDVLRQWGKGDAPGGSVWWQVAGRNKRSVTIDLRRAAGQQLCRDLAQGGPTSWSRTSAPGPWRNGGWDGSSCTRSIQG